MKNRNAKTKHHHQFDSLANIKLMRRNFLQIVMFSTMTFGCLNAQDAQSGDGVEDARKKYLLSVSDEIEKINIEKEKSLKNSVDNQSSAIYVKIPNIKPFVDFDYWYLDGELKWAANTDDASPVITVPKGFVTDLASIPSIFWFKFPPTGRYAYAAIVHDYLYWHQSIVSRSEADDILAAAMKDANVNGITVAGFKAMVNMFGESAWEKNKKAKNRGEKRILAKLPDNPLTSWSDWKVDPDNLKD